MVMSIYWRMDCTLVSMHWSPRDVARFRTELKLTQAQFAEKVGTVQTTVSKIENGKQAVWPMLAHLLTCMYERHQADKQKAPPDAEASEGASKQTTGD